MTEELVDKLGGLSKTMEDAPNRSLCKGILYLFNEHQKHDYNAIDKIQKLLECDYEEMLVNLNYLRKNNFLDKDYFLTKDAEEYIRGEAKLSN